MKAPALALAFVLALAAPVRGEDTPACPDTDVVPEASNIKRVNTAIVCLLNVERANAGLVPLAHDPLLDRASQQKTDDMVGSHYFAHEAPGRPPLLTRIMGTGYFFGAAGGLYTENLGVGPRLEATAANMVAAFMQSDHHRANILFATFRDVGIGATIAGPDPAFYDDRPSVVFATDFGRRYWHRPTRGCTRRPAAGDPTAAPRSQWCTKPRRKHRRRRTHR